MFGKLPKSIKLPETNIAAAENGWNTSFLLGWPMFKGELLVSEGVNCRKLHRGFNIFCRRYLGEKELYKYSIYHHHPLSYPIWGGDVKM